MRKKNLSEKISNYTISLTLVEPKDSTIPWYWEVKVMLKDKTFLQLQGSYREMKKLYDAEVYHYKKIFDHE